MFIRKKEDLIVYDRKFCFQIPEKNIDNIFANGIAVFYFAILSSMLHMKLHEKWSFSLWISSVNVAKSAVSCEFNHSYWRNPERKTSFLVQCGLPPALAVVLKCRLKYLKHEVFTRSMVKIKRKPLQPFKRYIKNDKIKFFMWVTKLRIDISQIRKAFSCCCFVCFSIFLVNDKDKNWNFCPWCDTSATWGWINLHKKS